MKRAAVTAAVAALLVPGASVADALPRSELRVWGATESLDRGQGDWTEGGLRIDRILTRDARFQAQWRETRRYGQRDREISGAFSVPLSPTTVLALDGTASGSHRVLPRWSAGGLLAHDLGGGWVASGGWSGRRYTGSQTQIAQAGIERYLGDWRLAYTAFLSRPVGAPWSPTHRVAATWYASERTSLTLSAARGRESENVPNAGLLTSEVRNLTLSGNIALSQSCTLVLDLERQRQGQLYTRETARLGALLRF